MENVKKFYDAIANDKGVQKRAAALSEKYRGEQPNEDVVKAELLSFAKAEGYEFTADELDTYSKKAQPVSDDIAEMAAGGLYDRNTCFCAVGGGGKDPDTGQTCACVVGGGGKKDKEGYVLCCIAIGWIDTAEQKGGN